MQYLLATGLVWLSTNVQAHPGHDHGSMFSGLVHLSLGLAIPAVAGALVFLFYRRRQNQTNKQKV